MAMAMAINALIKPIRAMLGKLMMVTLTTMLTKAVLAYP